MISFVCKMISEGKLTLNIEKKDFGKHFKILFLFFIFSLKFPMSHHSIKYFLLPIIDGLQKVAKQQLLTLVAQTLQFS